MFKNIFFIEHLWLLPLNFHLFQLFLLKQELDLKTFSLLLAMPWKMFSKTFQRNAKKWTKIFWNIWTRVKMITQTFQTCSYLIIYTSWFQKALMKKNTKLYLSEKVWLILHLITLSTPLNLAEEFFRRCSVNKVFFKIPQYLLEKSLCWSLFLIKQRYK